MSERALLVSVRKLLASVGRRGAFSLRPVTGGGNNRAYRVSTSDGPLFLKQYFDAARLNAEFSFARVAWSAGVRQMAQPLARDARVRLGLYSFLPGHPARPRDVTKRAVDDALKFFFAVNRATGGQARALPNAAEACFSLKDHLGCVERRLARLEKIRGATREIKAAKDFISSELIPAWKRLERKLLDPARKSGQNLSGKLPQNARRLSPSDFGFHNARIENGVPAFLDFEYAGWDDPAKMVNDFFCQPRIPVAGAFRRSFVAAVARRQPRPADFLRRAAWLQPVYEVKWCCIMLNDFLPAGRQRRRFAKGRSGEKTRMSTQVGKARQVLRRVMAREFGS